MSATSERVGLHAWPHPSVPGGALVVVEAQGVGYDVAFCASGLKRLPELGLEVFLHIFTKVREDAIELFGFVDPQEKEMFIVLLGVSGVGPKVAMNILAVASPAEVAAAVMADDLHRLTALPGPWRRSTPSSPNLENPARSVSRPSSGS